MIGSYLQEIMRPGPGGGPDFRRIDYLDYDRVEGRWKYVSMDTRLPVSIMPASSFGPAENDTLRLVFQPLGFIGFGTEVDGKLTRSDLLIRAVRPHTNSSNSTSSAPTGPGGSGSRSSTSTVGSTPGCWMERSNRVSYARGCAEQAYLACRGRIGLTPRQAQILSDLSRADAPGISLEN